MGTFEMPVKGRSAVRVAVRAHSTVCTYEICIYKGGRKAVACQVPQPGEFMKFATLALMSIRKRYWNEFKKEWLH